MSIDKDTARRVAHLARIAVDEAQLEPLATELSAILGFMEQLSEVDVTGVEPMTSVTPMHLPWREDVVTAGSERARRGWRHAGRRGGGGSAGGRRLVAAGELRVQGKGGMRGRTERSRRKRERWDE